MSCGRSWLEAHAFPIEFQSDAVPPELLRQMEEAIEAYQTSIRVVILAIGWYSNAPEYLGSCAATGARRGSEKAGSRS